MLILTLIFFRRSRGILSLFDLCGLTNALKDRFGVSCDVVTRSGLKDSVRVSAEGDGILIYER